jgi:hypothetical protein
LLRERFSRCERLAPAFGSANNSAGRRLDAPDNLWDIGCFAANFSGERSDSFIVSVRAPGGSEPVLRLVRTTRWHRRRDRRGKKVARTDENVCVELEIDVTPLDARCERCFEDDVMGPVLNELDVGYCRCGRGAKIIAKRNLVTVGKRKRDEQQLLMRLTV